MSLPRLQKDGTGEADTPSGGRSCNWWLIYHLWRLNTLQAGRAEHLASLCSPVNLGDSYLVPFLTLHWRQKSPPPQDVSCELHSSSQPASWEDMLGFGEIPIDSLPVHFSRSVRSNSLQPHGLQHARLPCPSPSPGACSNSCPSSQWCHPTISSSVISYSLCLPSFPTSGSFLRCHFFASGGQSIGVSASASVLPMHIQDWFPLGLTRWISLQSKGLSRVFSNTTVQKHQFFGAQLSLWSHSHVHIWVLEKP